MSTIISKCSLLIRPLPGDCESIRGYLFRLADVNGFGALRNIFTFVVDNEAQAYNLGRFGSIHAEVDKLTGVIPLADGVFSVIKRLDGLPLRFWNISFVRYCPLCLAELPVWRKDWELALIVACPKHRVKLIDHCQLCGKSIRWSRRNFLMCNCGQLLTENIPEVSLEHETQLSLLQSNVLNGNSNQDSEYALPLSLNLSQLLSLIWFLGGYSSGVNKSKPLKISGLYQVEVAREITNAAGHLLYDWPHNFHKFLYELYEHHSVQPNSVCLVKRFGFFYQTLYKNFSDDRFMFLHRAFEDFLQLHWLGALTKRNSRFSKNLLENHSRVHLPMAAKLLGVSRKKIKDLVTKGKLIAEVRVTNSNRRILHIDQNSLIALQQEQADLVSFIEARTLLNMSKKKFQAALKSGQIVAETGPLVDGAAIWKFSRSKLLAVINSKVIN